MTKHETVPLFPPVIEMKVGSSGYIAIWDISIVIHPKTDTSSSPEFYRYINLLGNVHPTLTPSATIKIERVGEGIQGSDYMLDFSECSEIVEFDEEQKFKLSTTSYLIKPHFVSENEQYNYMSIEDLEAAMKSLIRDKSKLYKDDQVQQVIKILINKIKKNLDYTDFYDLFGVFNDAYEQVNHFTSSSHKDAKKVEHQIALCELEISQATKNYAQKLLQEKFIDCFPLCKEEYRQELTEQITDSDDPLNFLEDILYQLKTIK